MAVILNEPGNPPEGAAPVPAFPVVPPPAPPANVNADADKTPPQRILDIRVIGLGAYLLLMIFVSVVAIVGLMMAETDQDKIYCREHSKSDDCRSIDKDKKDELASNMADSEKTNSAVTQSTATTLSPSGSPKPSQTTTPANVKANTSSASSNLNTNTTPTKTPAATPTPSPTPSKQEFARVSIPPKEQVYGLGIVTADSYVLLVVLFAGMLGAVIRVNYSFYKHLGFGDFTFNWSWFYILLPFFGAALSLVIYFIVRGGFYSSSYGEGLTLNLFSFAAFGAMTGLFSENAMEKLRQVAVTLLADTPPKVTDSKAIVDARDNVKGNPPPG